MSFSWWEQIAGPAQLLHTLIIAMCGASQVVLQIEKPLPFWDELYVLVCQQRLKLSPELINAEGISETPEEYLLRNHTSPVVRTGFRPAKHDLIAYLEESKALSGKLFWIVNAKGERGKQWHRFLASWAARDREKQTEFVLEYMGSPPGARKGVLILQAEEQLADYDMLLFAYGEMADVPGDLEIKQYLAWLTARLAEGDPERCRALCRENHALLWHPEEVLGEDFDRLLPLFRESQLRFCLPALERHRLLLVSHPEYRPGLKKLLPMVDDYNTRIEIPEEMELRHILHGVSRSRERIFPDEVRNDLYQMKGIRDGLMHNLGCGLAPEQLTFLLGNVQAELVAI